VKSRRWPLGLALALAAAWSCLDGTGPESRLAHLAIAPQFDFTGARAGGTSDVDSFVIVVDNPPLAPQTIVRRIPPGQDTIQISIVVDLTAAVDTVTITFSGYSSTSGLLLYSGSQSVVATAGIAATVPVTATYVGPGQGIDSLLVSPTALSLAPGDTATIDVIGYDANAPMPAADVPVYFSSADTLIARINAGGTVTAVGLGTTRVFATSLASVAIEDTADVTVTTVPNPAIGLSPANVGFADTVGTTSPAPANVSVVNAGGGTLSGLAIGTIAYGAGATGWLSASVSSATAPATVTLTASNAGLAAGVYTATVPVTSTNATNSPQSITVTYNLAGNPPVIALSPTSHIITDTLATADPAPMIVNITNTGGGTLGGLSVGTISYGPGATGWLSGTITPTTAPTTLSLQATMAGLAPGTYSATVPVTAAGAANSPQNVTVTFTVVAALPVRITATPGFAAIQPGGTQALAVSAQDVNGNPTAPGTVTWTSRSTGVATVNATTGLVTGVAGGAATIVATSALGPQDSVVVAVAAAGSAVVSAVADSRAFDAVQAGDTVRVLVEVNLAGVAPEKLGSYNDSLGWDPAVLTYVSSAPVTGGFAAPTVNTTNVANGILRFGAADANGAAGPVVGLIRITFVAQAAGSTALTQTLSDLTAAGTFTQMLPQALIVGSAVRVQ
jgi:hypothetical protein